MPSQVVGYYSSRIQRLLKDFDRTSELMKDSLVARYGEELANTLKRETRQKYENLVPEIPYIKGMRARALNTLTTFGAAITALRWNMEERRLPLTSACQTSPSAKSWDGVLLAPRLWPTAVIIAISG
jgi:hypothetical protein